MGEGRGDKVLDNERESESRLLKLWESKIGRETDVGVL